MDKSLKTINRQKWSSGKKIRNNLNAIKKKIKTKCSIFIKWNMA